MKYKVGDKVRIRQWKAMEREFGLDADGHIKTKIGREFRKEFDEFCGKAEIIV